MDRKRIRLAALLSVGVLVSACSSAATPAPATPAPATPAAATPAATPAAGMATPGASIANLAPAVSPPATPGDNGTVAFLPGQLSNPSQGYFWSMTQKHAAEYGFQTIVIDGKGDIATQTNGINSAVAQKVKAIIVNPNDAKGVIPAMTAARQAGACVGISMAKASDTDTTQASYDFWVSVDDVVGGQTAAAAIEKAFPNGATGVEIGGQAGHPAAIDRHNGFTQGIAGSNIKVLDYQNPQQWDAAQAQAIAANMITKYGSQMQFIFVHWDGGATGVIQALQAANVDPTKVMIIGVDGNKAAFANIKVWPNYISIQQDAEKIAQLDLQQAYNCATKNGKVQAANIVPFTVITKDNYQSITVPGW